MTFTVRAKVLLLLGLVVPFASLHGAPTNDAPNPLVGRWTLVLKYTVTRQRVGDRSFPVEITRAMIMEVTGARASEAVFKGRVLGRSILEGKISNASTGGPSVRFSLRLKARTEFGKWDDRLNEWEAILSRDGTTMQGTFASPMAHGSFTGKKLAGSMGTSGLDLFSDGPEEPDEP